MPAIQHDIMTNLGYGLYLAISIGMTIWVARSLSRAGLVFLIRCFRQDEDLAASTNRLLVIGFYLVNIGFITLRLEYWPVGPLDLIPTVGSRVGVSVLALGGMHFLNMWMIAKFGRSLGRWVPSGEPAQPPPLPPQ